MNKYTVKKEVTDEYLCDQLEKCQLGGKSLCYQLPPLIEGGLGIVISPLISLMQDQVAKLKSLKINAEYISSSQTKLEVQSIIKKLKDTTHDCCIRLLYITPERLCQTDFKQIILDLYSRNQLKLIAVDEAHCISTWGVDFRRSYRSIWSVTSLMPKVPVMALTASAPKKVALDIEKELHIDGCIKIKSDFNRPNLFYDIRVKDEDDGYNPLCSLIQKHLNESVLIYVRRKDEAATILTYLKYHNIAAVVYHASLTNKEREDNLNMWLSGAVHVIIGTIAVGMGVDKSDVRLVIHWNVPSSIYSYYQESGRGGRDGGLCQCIVFFNEQDFKSLRYTLCNAKDRNEKDIERDLYELECVYTMCTARACRRMAILKYFDEACHPTAPAKCCDYCKNPRQNQNNPRGKRNNLTVLSSTSFVKASSLYNRDDYAYKRLKFDGESSDSNDNEDRYSNDEEEESEDNQSSSESSDHEPIDKTATSRHKIEYSLQEAREAIVGDVYISTKQRIKCIQALESVYSPYISIYLHSQWVPALASRYAMITEEDIYQQYSRGNQSLLYTEEEKKEKKGLYVQLFTDIYKPMKLNFIKKHPIKLPYIEESHQETLTSSSSLNDIVGCLFKPYFFKECQDVLINYLYKQIYESMKEELKTKTKKEVVTKYKRILRKQIELKQPFFDIKELSKEEEKIVE
ncbi:hypothetical protein WA158_007166 [Blastocystis sp. Blastoise]